jgi:hypothetical protein
LSSANGVSVGLATSRVNSFGNGYETFVWVKDFLGTAFTLVK